MNKKDMEKARIISTLDGDGEKNRFYVYALCDENHKPFYIGKGQGGRVWEHEKGEEKEREAIEKNEKLSLDEKETFLNDLSEKHKKINEIKKRGFEVEKVIIKWGLTENEAFMAESALINLYSYSEKGLTNLANGHSSQREKENIYRSTCAMNDKNFYFNCCKEPIAIDDIEEKCVFISINEYYDSYADKSFEEKCEMICETARGCWQIGNNRECPKYLVATYKGKIYGIFAVTGIKSMLEVSGLPKHPKPLRTAEEECILAIKESDNPSEFSSLSEKAKEKYRNFKNDFIKKDMKYENWIKRKYFVCEGKIPQKMEDLMGRYVKKENGDPISRGNPIVYNY